MDIGKVLGAEFSENFIIHRADLHAAILSGLEKSCLHTDHECERIEQTAAGVRAVFKNGALAEGDLLIGGDGLHSAVRIALFARKRAALFRATCFRAVADIAPRSPSVLAEIQGTGQRFGIARSMKNAFTGSPR
jgi:2-polyprenyl-6-methoxyphenol hydroxylase-like FAD-dependent oxidoreductase